MPGHFSEAQWASAASGRTTAVAQPEGEAATEQDGGVKDGGSYERHHSRLEFGMCVMALWD